MKKKLRQDRILDLVNAQGTITVSQIMDELNVSDMTVRRDLTEMSDRGLLIRTHGGARRLPVSDDKTERSHTEKSEIQNDEKSRIVSKAASFIHDGETIFIGPGTTLALLAEELRNRTVRIVTNSLPVFELLNRSQSVDLLLVGGEYRAITGAFVGSVPCNVIKSMHFSKSFISANAISDTSIFTYSEAEGEVQKIALNQAVETFLLADSTKFERYDFYDFYEVADLTHIITDQGLNKEDAELLKEKTDLILV